MMIVCMVSCLLHHFTQDDHILEKRIACITRTGIWCLSFHCTSYYIRCHVLSSISYSFSRLWQQTHNVHCYCRKCTFVFRSQRSQVVPSSSFQQPLRTRTFNICPQEFWFFPCVNKYVSYSLFSLEVKSLLRTWTESSWNPLEAQVLCQRSIHKSCSFSNSIRDSSWFW
jgi:hypothetical protein